MIMKSSGVAQRHNYMYVHVHVHVHVLIQALCKGQNHISKGACTCILQNGSTILKRTYATLLQQTDIIIIDFIS